MNKKLILTITAKSKHRTACKEFAAKMWRELHLVAIECNYRKPASGWKWQLEISFNNGSTSAVAELKSVLEGECSKFLEQNTKCTAEVTSAE